MPTSAQRKIGPRWDNFSSVSGDWNEMNPIEVSISFWADVGIGPYDRVATKSPNRNLSDCSNVARYQMD